MRLIDADKLKEHDFGDDYYVIKAEIDTEPTVQAIPIEVLDKIRDEIEHLHYHPKLDFIKNDEVVEIALNIIDKYRAGSNETQTNEIVYDIGGHMCDVIMDILAGKGKR